jgi:hypothetical protein
MNTGIGVSDLAQAMVELLEKFDAEFVATGYDGPHGRLQLTVWKDGTAWIEHAQGVLRLKLEDVA